MTKSQVTRTVETLDDLLPTDAELAQAAESLVENMTRIRTWTKGWIAAWNARDIDAIAACVTDDIVYDDPGMYGELVQGMEHFRANIEMVFRAFPDLLFVPSEWSPLFSIDGTQVAAPCRAITRFSGDMRGGPSKVALAGNNSAIDVFCLDLYQFRDGKLARWTALNQEFEMARQIGMLPSSPRLIAVMVRLQRAVAALQRRTRRS